MAKSKYSREPGKTFCLNRTQLLKLLKEQGVIPNSPKSFVVEVEKGDEVFNVNDVDCIVVSW